MAARFVLLCASGTAATWPATWPAEGHRAPVLLFGPTANHKDIGTETLELVATGSPGWSEVQDRLRRSGGALHVRLHALDGSAGMTAEQQRRFAERVRAAKLRLSLEAGGAVCGSGSGNASAAKALGGLDAFLGAGGSFAFLGLESSFSRTYASCKEQPLEATVREVADYAAAMHTALPSAKLFLYDALPHFRVENFPANVDYGGMELLDVLGKLRVAMDRRGAPLEGYWADCPYEYSRDLEGADGFEKIAHAVKLIRETGLRVGKTINSQAGGQSSNRDFHDLTLTDFAMATEKVPSSLTGGYSFDYLMVESWYTYPDALAPETTANTMANAARDIFRQIRDDSIVV